jgi:fructose-bisphosphate aldolase class I
MRKPGPSPPTQLLIPGGAFSGVIMYKETLYQSAADGTPFVDLLLKQGVLPGIKVDEVRRMI